MLIRRAPYGANPQGPTHLVIASSFREGLHAVGEDIKSVVKDNTTGQAEVYANPDHVAERDLLLLGLPHGVTCRLTHADQDFTDADSPRAEISLDVATPSDSFEKETEQAVYCHWELRVCPPGLHPDIHELVEILIWDAEESGDYLERTQAIKIASAMNSH